MDSKTSNILSLPFRRSVHLSLATTIRQYINAKYDQHPDMFRPDLEAIDVLRNDAINVREPHSSGIKKLQAYAAQLVWIGGKFPIDIGAEFTWYPALGYNTERPMVRNNLKYELMNVLYNLASLYSQLAINTSRSNTDGLKTAANYFSQAAGVLSHMKTSILPELRMPDPPEDMDEHTLESLTQLLLAQSQECFWQKAVMDGLKDALISKLAARVSDLYNLAGESAVKSEAISSAWIHHMTAKHHHFAAAAQYRAACDCLEKRKYGEEVARLQDAVQCVNEGVKETKGGYLNKIVVEDLQALKRKVEEDLKRAEKDNDIIFLNIVPPKSELKILDRANMAVARVPKQVSDPYEFFGDKAEFGPALFSRLVPFSVHVAISIYEERRDRMVNQNIVHELETMTDQLHNVLASLGLPGSIQAIEKPLGLPPSLVQHAEEIRQADAVNRIQKSFVDIDKLRAADMAIFEEGVTAMAAEFDEDQQLRGRYGTDRWSRPDGKTEPQGAKLWGQVTEIESYFESSASSDAVVREKYATAAELLRILSGSDAGIQNYVPSGGQMDMREELRTAMGKLRSAHSDAIRLDSKRRRKVASLKENAKRDDIKPDILKEAARLERTYPTTTIALDKDAKEQDQLVTLLERTNREFEAQKQKGSSRANREREQALQRLDSAYYKYKEILNNLDVGRKFYNDLSKIVGQGFRDVAKSWVAQRRMEARALEEELSMPTLSNLNISRNHTPVHNGPPQGMYQQHPQQSYYGGMQQQQGGPVEAAAIQSWAGAGGNVQQPQPMPPVANPMGGMWTPNSGIKFGGGPSQPGSSNTGDGQQQPGQGTWNPNAGIKFG
ncbi:hypothetical protein NLG97_g6089 [Lecanicillium saksenae]|uniref:Uncharacterized protein n=1 Tax=Lecanicillium saksenae TaxID=468837 RepID=A0ACC1QQL7_9HYPO|nr:hypothetical protein NLG97_g6089 [Lecanicillium saksenae]